MLLVGFPVVEGLDRKIPVPLSVPSCLTKPFCHVENAFKQNWIPGFDARLSVNFNHLMFFANLINVTRSSQSAAKACKLCLEIYKDHIGQMVNMNKSNVYFPNFL